MKAILTYLAIFAFAFLSMAQGNKSEVNMEFPMETVGVQLQEEPQTRKRIPKSKRMVRLYLFKNSRVKKELSFRTKRNKSKLA